MKYDATLPPTGFLRAKQIHAPHGLIPISPASWWLGVKQGIYPKPVKLGPNTTAWRVEDIRALIERLGATESKEARS